MNYLYHPLSRRELLQALSRLGLSGTALACARTQGAGEPPARRVAAPAADASHREGGQRPRKPFVLGYYPDWAMFDPARLDFALFTHLCHAFVSFDSNGAAHFPEEAKTRALVSAAHAKSVKTLLSVGGAESNAMLRAQNTDAFADLLARRVHDFGYDGLDIDWEAPGNESDGAKLSALMQALRRRLPDALLTLAVPADNYSGQWFQTKSLLPITDWINIMTYDFCGAWCDKALQNAPMPEVTKAIAYWKERGWPARKLMLGIPNYGRRMRANHFGDPAPAGTYVGDEVAYITVQKLIQQGWKPMRDPEAQVPYLIKPGGGELLSYDDATSARLKGHLAQTADLRGFFFWEVTSDFDGKTHLLTRAAREGWQAGR